MTALAHRYDFVLLFDVTDGNPNGDPDAGNLPRIDAETGLGLVTDVCLKRKVRNYISLAHDQSPREPQAGEKRYEIYVREKAVLNLQHQRAYAALNLEAAEAPAEAPTEDASEEKPSKGKARARAKEKRKGSAGDAEQARAWMCQNFYDVRTFGAVMSTGVNCGQVRGPVQLTLARSIDPIVPQEHSITRVAVTTEAEAEKQQGDNRTMGRKYTVPYGLYRAHGFVSAHLARQTGFDETDLQQLWQALSQMFEHDHAASRGQMSARALYVFRHDSELGNAPAHRLFDLITIRRREDVAVARHFSDYQITINREHIPAGVELDEQAF